MLPLEQLLLSSTPTQPLSEVLPSGDGGNVTPTLWDGGVEDKLNRIASMTGEVKMAWVQGTKEVT